MRGTYLQVVVGPRKAGKGVLYVGNLEGFVVLAGSAEGDNEHLLICATSRMVT